MSELQAGRASKTNQNLHVNQTHRSMKKWNLAQEWFARIWKIGAVLHKLKNKQTSQQAKFVTFRTYPVTTTATMAKHKVFQVPKPLPKQKPQSKSINIGGKVSAAMCSRSARGPSLARQIEATNTITEQSNSMALLLFFAILLLGSNKI